jgi:uncharacterized protein
MIKHSLSEVKSFLNYKSIALVGTSRDAKHMSRSLMTSMIDNGIDVIPVHPEAESIEGRKCYKRLGDIESTPEAVIVMLNKSMFKEIVEQCITAGIKNVWLYGVIGPKSIDEDLQNYCLENGINLIAGYCPFMFLEKTDTFHKFHGFIWKMVGLYPKK